MRRHHRCSEGALLTLLLLSAWTPVAAQTPPPLSSGDRVRVGTDTGEIHEGRVTCLSSGQLQLRSEGSGAPLSLPMATITDLDVRRERSRALPGALIGAGAGALTGLVLCAGGERCVYTHLNGGRNDFTAELPLILGVAGGVAGFVIGRRLKHDGWLGIPVDRLRVDLAPSPMGGAGLRFAIGG